MWVSVMTIDTVSVNVWTLLTSNIAKNITLPHLAFLKLINLYATLQLTLCL